MKESEITRGGEIWKPVVGYEGHYEVSNLGRVRSVKPRITQMIPCRIKRIKNWGPRVFKPQKLHEEYLQVCLSKNNIRKSKAIYKLVAMAFIPNPEKKPCVNHINGIKSDNRVENLEWVTYQENSDHAVRTGLLDTRGEKNKNSKLTADDVRRIREMYGAYTGKQLAELFHVHYSNIGYILNRITWKHV
jgi:hypothetical protein